MADPFFTADTHFWHKNVIEYCKRPFTTVEEMNEVLIANWNTAVAPNDTIYHLGDFGFCSKRNHREIFDRLNGIKHLVVGNHDGFSSRFYLDIGWNSVHQEWDLDHLIKLCHYPVTGDSHDGDRYTHLRPKVHSSCVLLHGHIHDMWKKKENQINVGVDVWDYKPVSMQEILALLVGV